jgi:hypothetical protein
MLVAKKLHFAAQHNDNCEISQEEFQSHAAARTTFNGISRRIAVEERSRFNLSASNLQFIRAHPVTQIQPESEQLSQTESLPAKSYLA